MQQERDRVDEEDGTDEGGKEGGVQEVGADYATVGVSD